MGRSRTPGFPIRESGQAALSRLEIERQIFGKHYLTKYAHGGRLMSSAVGTAYAFGPLGEVGPWAAVSVELTAPEY
jgi:hypothetical protein